jgi:hypothetical protein
MLSASLILGCALPPIPTLGATTWRFGDPRGTRTLPSPVDSRWPSLTAIGPIWNCRAVTIRAISGPQPDVYPSTLRQHGGAGASRTHSLPRSRICNPARYRSVTAPLWLNTAVIVPYLHRYFGSGGGPRTPDILVNSQTHLPTELHPNSPFGQTWRTEWDLNPRRAFAYGLRVRPHRPLGAPVHYSSLTNI